MFLLKFKNLKFAANVSTMFTDCGDITERMKEAKRTGFHYVEAECLYDIPVHKLLTAKAELKLEFVMLNSPPGVQVDFHQALVIGITKADMLACKRINILPGLTTSSGVSEETYRSFFVSTLTCISEALEEYNVTGVIQPVSPEWQPCWFLNSYDKAIDILREVGKENIQLLLDIDQLKKMSSNFEDDLVKCLAVAGHIRISIIPEKFSPANDYCERVLQMLEDGNYRNYIGCTYTLDTGESSLDVLNVSQPGPSTARDIRPRSRKTVSQPDSSVGETRLRPRKNTKVVKRVVKGEKRLQARNKSPGYKTVMGAKVSSDNGDTAELSEVAPANSNMALPDGWTRIQVERKSGKTAGKIDVYIYSPEGIKFRSRPAVASYLKQKKLQWPISCFNFGKE